MCVVSVLMHCVCVMKAAAVLHWGNWNYILQREKERKDEKEKRWLFYLSVLSLCSWQFVFVFSEAVLKKDNLSIPLALCSISGEAGKLCLELYAGLQATAVRRPACSIEILIWTIVRKTVERQELHPCVWHMDNRKHVDGEVISLRSAFLDIELHGFTTVIHGRQVTRPTTEVQVIYHTINRLHGPRVTV